MVVNGPELIPKLIVAFHLTVNGKLHRVDADPQTPLLWVVRDDLGLCGTKGQLPNRPVANYR